MLTINDLNTIIKFYAYNLPQRIDELNHLTSTCLEQEYHSLQVLSIIDKYQMYCTQDEKQLKLAKKLVERVQQIYQFFKQKSNNQNLLNIIQHKINLELAELVSGKSIKLGELFSYIHLIAKRNGMIRVPAQKRRIFSKSLLREPKQSRVVPTTSFNNLQHRKHHTSMRHTKAVSVVCQKWKLEDILSGPLNCLQIDKGFLGRIKENTKVQATKDMMRRNERLLSMMRVEEKIWKTGHTQMSEEVRQGTILSEMKTNTMKNSWLSKRRRPGGLPKKRYPTLKQNISIYP